MTLERRPECENRTSEGGPILLTGDHNHFRQCEQMDIGLMGSRAWWLRTGATWITVPKPPRYIVYQYMTIIRAIQIYASLVTILVFIYFDF